MADEPSKLIVLEILLKQDASEKKLGQSVASICKTMGMEPRMVGDRSITVEVEQGIFKEIFGFEVTQSKEEVNPIVRDFGSSDGYRSDQILQIPGKLSDLVKNISISMPHTYF